jgi:hypothetical protein
MMTVDPWTFHFEVSVGIKPYEQWPSQKKTDLIKDWLLIIKKCLDSQ